MADSKYASLGFGRKVYSAEHDEYRTQVRRFFQKEIEPNVKQWEKDTEAGGMFPKELFKKAGQAGLLCVGLPEEYGGGGGDFLHHCILHEEHGYSTAGPAMESGLGTDLVSYVLYNCGTEEQKKEYLPQFAAGDIVCEFGLTEITGGSDNRGMKTTARRDGDDYIINGSKMWMSNAPIMNMLFVVAKTLADDGRQQHSLFIVPFGKGVTVGKRIELMLRGAGGVAQVFFEDVRVPKRNLLGGIEGKGLKDALSTLSLGRATRGARYLAACELALELTVDYVQERKAFGQRIADFQNTQFKLATVKADITVGRAFVDDCLEKLNRNALDPVTASIAKLWVSEMEGRVMDECLQFFGANGYTNEYPISKMYAYARLHRIYVGTSEIQRLIIARSLFPERPAAG